MKAQVESLRLQHNADLEPELVIGLKHSVYDHSELNDIAQDLANGKNIELELKQVRKGRSLNANAYMWVLLDKLARKLNSSKDELYYRMLIRYGVMEHLMLKKIALPSVKRLFRVVRIIGESGDFIQAQCFIGSSQYDSKEMATLIDGVASECKEVGIDTMTQEELTSLAETWKPMIREL